MQPLLASLFDETERRPISVSELTTQIRATLENRFMGVWVEGEVSNFRAHNSGHWYFTLKDEFAQVRAACYRSSNQRIRFRLEDGMQVRARGRLSVYEPKGEYQLIADSLEPVGAGALQLAFEQTKARLQAEGLFAETIARFETDYDELRQLRHRRLFSERASHRRRSPAPLALKILLPLVDRLPRVPRLQKVWLSQLLTHLFWNGGLRITVRILRQGIAIRLRRRQGGDA